MFLSGNYRISRTSLKERDNIKFVLRNGAISQASYSGEKRRRISSAKPATLRILNPRMLANLLIPAETGKVECVPSYRQTDRFFFFNRKSFKLNTQ